MQLFIHSNDFYLTLQRLVNKSNRDIYCVKKCECKVLNMLFVYTGQCLYNVIFIDFFGIRGCKYMRYCSWNRWMIASSFVCYSFSK